MYTVNLNYETTYEDDDYISLIITSGWYNGQSAHGYYTSQGLVFDKHTGNLIPATNYVHLKDDEQLYKLVMEGMLPVFSSREHQLQYNEFQILDKKFRFVTITMFCSARAKSLCSISRMKSLITLTAWQGLCLHRKRLSILIGWTRKINLLIIIVGTESNTRHFQELP